MRKYAKFWWAFAAAAATAVGAVATDGITGEEWIYVLVTGLAAVGVIFTPNKTD